MIETEYYGATAPMLIKFKKLSENAYTPTRGSSSAAGWDMYAVGDYEIAPHGCVKVPTDIAVEIPEGYFGALYSRSGTATKKGLRLANCTGVIDSDYRGNCIAAMYNDSNEMQYIEKGERIAQLIITPYLPVEFVEVDELSETERGSGGFGSTGTK